MMKVRVRVSTNKIGSDSYNEIEIDDEDLEGLSEEEKEKEIDKLAFDVICESMIDWGWQEVKE